MTDIKKAFQPLKGNTEEKSLSSKHQIEVLSRAPAPEAAATTSTPNADTSGNASAKEGKK
jgi:hypothetical protein